MRTTFKEFLMEGKPDPKALAAKAQAVWAAKGVEAKKAAMRDMINSMEFKEKTEKFLSDLERLNSEQRIDSFAANVQMAGEGHSRIK